LQTRGLGLESMTRQMLCHVGASELLTKIAFTHN
jgi:hypothetical protein